MMHPIYTNILENKHFKLHGGIFYDETEQVFARMDLEIAKKIAGHTYFSKNSVYTHAREAVGGRIRFSTNSSYIAIKATLYHWDDTYSAAMVPGKFGFDVYVDTEDGRIYAGMISATADEPGEVQVEGRLELGDVALRSLTVYFPLTSETKFVEIGVESGALIGEHQYPYNNEKPVVYYGSSLEQGGCAKKPSGNHVALTCAELNADFINLGVWGSCKGQSDFAQYLAGLDMSVFMMCYDPNERNPEILASRHYNFYQIVRDSKPGLPIILITRSSNSIGVTKVEDMKAVVRATYERAADSGDRNIHFIDGKAYFNYSPIFLADNAHPNDNGHAKMGELNAAVLRRVLNGEKNIVITPENVPQAFEEIK